MNKKYVSTPIIFLDEEKRKEWDSLDESAKKNIYSMLHSYTDKMEMKKSIEMLCNVIIDMNKRIQGLEKRIKENGRKSIN
jgi:hypothetical protein